MNTESIFNSQSGTNIISILSGNARFKRTEENDTSKLKLTEKKSAVASRQITTVAEILSGVTLIHVNNVKNLKKLITLLEGALAQAMKSDAQVQPVIEFVQDGIENIMNPHKALENELASFIQAQTPPNGEFYKFRADKSELAVAFFYRVYGRFYEANVLFQHHIRSMDRDFYDNFLKAKDRPNLPSKSDSVDRDLARVVAPSMRDLPRLSVALRRRTMAA